MITILMVTRLIYHTFLLIQLVSQQIIAASLMIIHYLKIIQIRSILLRTFHLTSHQNHLCHSEYLIYWEKKWQPLFLKKCRREVTHGNGMLQRFQAVCIFIVSLPATLYKRVSSAFFGDHSLTPDIGL